MIAQILIGLALAAGITFAILYATGVFGGKKNNKKDQTKSNNKHKSKQNNYSYINPQPFKTGHLKNSPQFPADNCNKNMYPVQPPLC